MPYKIKVVPKKIDIQFVVPQYVIEAPSPGVYGGCFGPHSTWDHAREHFARELRITHIEGNTYVYDGREYSDPEQLIKALKEPH